LPLQLAELLLTPQHNLKALHHRRLSLLAALKQRLVDTKSTHLPAAALLTSLQPLRVLPLIFCLLAAVVAVRRAQVQTGNLTLPVAVLVECCTTLLWLFPLARIQLVLVLAVLAGL
jgi:hypothetical protein